MRIGSKLSTWGIVAVLVFLAGCNCGNTQRLISVNPDPNRVPDASVIVDAGGPPDCGDALDVSGCGCTPGTPPRSCYPGPAELAGVGACVTGEQHCMASSSELSATSWGPCVGAGHPISCDDVPEVCGALSDGCGGVLQCGSCPDAGTPDAGTPDAGLEDAGTPDAGCGPDGASCGVVALCQPLGQCMAGVCVQPPPTVCGTGDLQVTVTWDDQGLDMELHLIRPNGHLNDATNGSDCTWTTCVGRSPDWGVIGDPSDDPHKDVDNTGNYGPENIYLNNPEPGVFAVYVEHWGPTGLPSTAQVTISIHQQVVFTASLSSFVSHHVWDVARIAWPAGQVTAGTGGDIDCTASWRGASAGCDLVLP